MSIELDYMEYGTDEDARDAYVKSGQVYFYNESVEDVAWVVGYSSGTGAQSKEADHLYLEAAKANNCDRTYVTNVSIDLTPYSYLLVEWDSNGTNPYATRFSAGTVKMTRARLDEDVKGGGPGVWGRHYTWLDVSAVNENRYIKVAIEGAAVAPGLSKIRVYRVLGVSLECFSEGTIKVQGSYSLGMKAAVTGSLNDTLTRTVAPTIDLTDIIGNKLYIRASRTGSNIKIGIKDSGGTWTEITPNVASANEWQAVDWDISAVSNVNKDVINTIRITIINADSENIFYLDDMFGGIWGKIFIESITLGDTLVKAPAKILTESLILADTLQKKPAKVFSENLNLADTLIKRPVKIFTESIALNDIYLRVWNIYRTFTETLNLADSLIKKPIKTFIESLHLADTLIKRPGKIFTETINLADTYLRRWRIYRTFTETLSLTDRISKKAVKTFLETLHLQDRYTRVVTWYRTFTEKITLIDTVKKIKSNLLLLWKKLQNLFDIEGH